MNGNVLKSLFLYRNGENKGFVEYIKDKRNNDMFEDVWDKFIERHGLIVCDKDLETIKKLHDLCVDSSNVDSELAKHVDYLYKNVYQKSSRCGGVS